MDFAPAIVSKLRERAARFDELTEQLSQQGVAANPRRLTELVKERGPLEPSARLVGRLESLARSRAECEKVLADEDGDEDLRELAQAELDEVEASEETLEQEMREALVTDEDDTRTKVIVELRAGTGGDEATLFAADLFRIYKHFADARRWKVEVLESSASDVGGFKEIIFAVEGSDAWRLLRFESGGHRVQRVPATEAQGRIHTSAATVAVLPEAEEVELEIDPGDLRIDTMRAGGAGGQHVNKTESAVRITHLPTGTMVVCMDEKSQHKNRQRAMRILRSRLLDAERARVAKERSDLRRSQVGSGDRNERVRTYNYPQNRVTDHRLGRNFSLEQIENGRLDALLEALDAAEREERIRNL
jgi:peptide chain release factor 1